MRVSVSIAVLAVALAGCAGRDPAPIATAQIQDSNATCAQIQAEIQANNSKVKELADEQGWKVAQNVVAGVAGLVIWPLWFAMDFKGAASKDVTALQARQQYLAILASERCAPAAAPPRRAGTPHPRTAAAVPAPAAERLPPEAYYQPPPPPPEPELAPDQRPSN